MKKLRTPFGARYGSTLRKRYAEIMKEYKKPKECPNCGKVGKIKRIKIGIWQCPKCGVKFTGAAYTISSPIGKIIKYQAIIQQPQQQKSSE
jgi:large subunit ribosomal protein L37Ae